MSGFAKILAPNWRVGYLAAPPDLVERLLDTKLLSTPTHRPSWRRRWPVHRPRPVAPPCQHMRLRLARRARAACSWRWRQVALCRRTCGLFGWVETGVDTDVLAQRMLDRATAGARGVVPYQ